MLQRGGGSATVPVGGVPSRLGSSVGRAGGEGGVSGANGDRTNAPLFPSAAAAAGSGPPGRSRPPSNVWGPNTTVMGYDESERFTASEGHDGPIAPGAGCLWCWHVGNNGSNWPAWRDLLPAPLSSFLRERMDYLDIEGYDTFPAASAEWSKPSATGLVCRRAPVTFDPWNVNGAKAWSKAASGTIVVARRGAESFETVTKNAQRAGALAVIFVDEEEPLDTSIELCLESSSPTPIIPAIMVGKASEDPLCSGRQLYASIIRR